MATLLVVELVPPASSARAGCPSGSCADFGTGSWRLLDPVARELTVLALVDRVYEEVAARRPAGARPALPGGPGPVLR